MVGDVLAQGQSLLPGEDVVRFLVADIYYPYQFFYELPALELRRGNASHMND